MKLTVPDSVCRGFRFAGRQAPSQGIPLRITLAQRGFTLIELAIVLFIVALLLGGMLLPLSAQQDIRARQETDRVLSEARDALLGFVVVNSRLPCPDIENDADAGGADGAEDGSVAACEAQEGDFPYQTLGTSQSDGWNYRLRYRVSSTFSGTIALTSAGDITVITRGDDPTTAGTTESKHQNSLVTTAPAVIFSVGKNGYGGMPREGGTRMSLAAAQPDEILNSSGATKVFRTPSPVNSGCGDDEVEATPLCEFDDQLVWLSANTIFNRLVAAGKL
ncbi:MAG: prepilin-type N-terminal cleavage/methylation domain-containing protein [Sulfuritalea sp.]|nr:prepilin-type N-terminal cleavage/methylation domain-containing protein [Sulfuritalea sp.]MDP1980955.1 prepilin-type N-terminal cleavage/methylation domain-containing protein [Sulfuritalea sp.]